MKSDVSHFAVEFCGGINYNENVKIIIDFKAHFRRTVPSLRRQMINNILFPFLLNNMTPLAKEER